MSMSRKKRKHQLIKRMEELGYIYLGVRKFWWDDLSPTWYAQPHSLMFKADPLLESLLEAWLKQPKNEFKMHKNEFLRPLFSRRWAMHRWLETTGKLIQKKIWKMKV